VTKHVKHSVSVDDLVVAARAAYRIGVIDVLLRSAHAHSAIREALEAERRQRLDQLRLVGMTEIVFEDVA